MCLKVQHTGEIITCQYAFEGLTIKQAVFAKVPGFIRQGENSVGAMADFPDVHWGRGNGDLMTEKPPPLTVGRAG